MTDTSHDAHHGDESHADIVKPLSAYMHFQKLRSGAIRDEMVQNNLDIGGGALMTAISAKWKSLSDTERGVYEKLAVEDKKRYEEECILRDAEVARQQAERREKNQLTETETRMRGTTLARTEAAVVKSETRRTRIVSEEEQERKDAKKKAKQDIEDAVRAQHAELKASKAEQAEARLKYLLSQSDIFSHFGLNSANKKQVDNTPASPESPRHRGRAAAAASEADLDEDELAMLGEEAEEEDVPAKGHSVMLQRQPTVITGGTMRAYQLEGLNWLIRLQENGINGILADEMGLGKTLQSISILAYMLEYKKVSGPHLIIVPKSTLSNWINEFAFWCPSLRTLRFHGDKDERREIASHHLRAHQRPEDREWDVCVTTYEILNMEKSALSRIAWKYLIIDEAHRLKNEASLFSQTIRMVNTEHRLLLTGTPLQNNLHELWALLNFLLPDVFASADQFDEWFNLDVDDKEAKQRMIGQLHKILRPFMLRRLKADVETSLPPKTETILFTGMSVMQKQLYRKILLRDIDQINSSMNSSDSSSSRTAVLNIVMQLRKCCNHPYLFPGIEDRTLPPLGDHLYLNCGKMVLLDKLLAKLKARNHRVLLFSQMTRMLDILEDYFVLRGYSYCRIDGNTSYEDREDSIATYNAPNSEKFVFLLSTRAGGLGINLQSADTVIIYDSDWNPQADLQAQDRCHRIGQKKQVHVYRLVTDDSVEVKVVERAQQKLKLDAMVVQQGRLMDKEKKMSKNELLETVKFGADKIFRTKDSTDITDDDIDLILEAGKKRTEEMNAMQVVADKGDMYDFRLDGGMSTQVFEGKDYSDKTLRESELNPFAAGGMAFLDTGKRERKTITSYNDTTVRRTPADEDKRPKLPRHLRLPKMEDWQFYNRARLTELQDIETKLFDEMVDKGNVPNTIVSKIVVLPPELQEEKTKLLNEAFGDMNRVHYNNFLKASAKYGRNEYAKIAEDVGKSLADITRFADTFWKKGPVEFAPAEWEKVVKQVEKGEKRLDEIQRLTAATGRLVSLFSDPWEELTFRHVGTQGRMFNSIEDRYLLCLTHLHGFGNWDRVKISIRQCERFRFDYYLLSCSAETIGKRCEALMRLAEKELNEMDKRQQALEPAAKSSSADKGSDATKQDRMSELVKQIAEEARKLALTRAELQKAKTGDTGPIAANLAATSMKMAGKAAPPASVRSDDGGSTAGKTSVLLKSVPDEYLEDLARIVAASGADGMGRLVTKFVAQHPDVSKRQTEIKVNEIAVKEKWEGDAGKMWHVRKEFEHLLNESTAKPSESSKKRKKSTGSKNNVDTPKPTPKKARKESSPSPEPTSTSPPPTSNKKAKTAFHVFVKEKRSEVEEEMGEDASMADLKERLIEMWEALADDERDIYEKSNSCSYLQLLQERMVGIAELDITYGAALAPSGFHRVTQLNGEQAELNRGAGGSASYLWWKEGDGRLEPIVDIQLVEREEDVPADYDYVPRNIYTDSSRKSLICFRRGRDTQPLDDIAVVYGDCANIGMNLMLCSVLHGTESNYTVLSPPLSKEPKRISLIYRRAAAGAPSKWSPYALQVGDWCDARDSVNSWCVGQIVECNESAVKVHFKGWASKWDEVIPRNSPRLAELRHHTAGLDTGCLKRVQGSLWDVSADQLSVLSQRIAGSQQLSGDDRDVLWNAELPGLVEKLLSSSYSSSTVVAAVSVVLRDVISLLVAALKDVSQEFTPGKQQMLCRLVGIDNTCSYFYDTYGHLPGIASPELQVDASLLEGPVAKVAKSSHRLIPLTAAPIATSRLLVITLNHFAIQGGFDGVLMRMQQQDTSLVLVHTLTTFIKGLAPHINKKFLASFLPSFQDLLMKYLYALQSSSLKAIPDRNKDIIDSILKEFEQLMKIEAKDFPIYETIEKYRLHYCLVQLSSPLLNLRLRGINLLTELIEAVGRREASKKGYASYLNYGKATDSACHWLTSVYLSQWLQQSDVLGLIFGDVAVLRRYNMKDTHDEILRRCGDVLTFLAERSSLTQSHLDTLWQHTKGSTSTCSVIYKLLISVVPKLQHPLLALLITYMHELTSNLDESKIQFIQAVVDGVLVSGYQSDSQENGLDILWSTCFNEEASDTLRVVAARSLVSVLSKPPAKRQLLLHMEKCISAVQKCSADACVCARIVCDLIDAQNDPYRVTNKGGAMSKAALLDVCTDRFHAVEAAVTYIKYALRLLKEQRTTNELETLSVGVHLLQYIYTNSATLIMEFAFLYELWVEFISVSDADAMEIFYGFVESICPEDVPVGGVAYNPNGGSFYSNNKSSTPTKNTSVSLRSKCCLDETSLHRVLMEIIGSQVKKSRVYRVPLGAAGYATLERLFRRVNHMQKKVTFGYNRQVFTVISPDIIALDILVYAYIGAADHSVVSQAATFLVNLQMKLANSVNKRDLWEQFALLTINLVSEFAGNEHECSSFISRLLWLLVKFLREIQSYTGTHQSSGSYGMIAAATSNTDPENVRITVFWRKETSKSSNHNNLILHVPRKKVTVGALRSRIAKDLRWPTNRVRLIHNRKFVTDKQDAYLLEDIGVMTFIDVVLLQGEAEDTSNCVTYPVARTLAEMAGSDQMHTREIVSENSKYLSLLFSLCSDATADAAWTLLEMLPVNKSIFTEIATFGGVTDEIDWMMLLCGEGGTLEMMYRVRILLMLLNGSTDADGAPTSASFVSDFVKHNGLAALVRVLMSHPNLSCVSKLHRRALCILLQTISVALTSCADDVQQVIAATVSPIEFTSRIMHLLSASVQPVRRHSEANDDEAEEDEQRREKLREARRRLRMARNEAYVNHTTVANDGLNNGSDNSEENETIAATAVSLLIDLLQRIVTHIPDCISVIVKDDAAVREILCSALLSNADDSLRHATELALHQLCAALSVSSPLLHLILVEMCALLPVACGEMPTRCSNYFNFLARVVKMSKDSHIFTSEMRRSLLSVVIRVLSNDDVREVTEEDADPLLQGCLKVMGMLLHYDSSSDSFCSEQEKSDLVEILYSNLLFSLESGSGPRCKNSTTRGFAQVVLKGLLLNHDTDGAHFDRFVPLASAHHTLEHKQMALKSEKTSPLPLIAKSRTGYSGIVNPGCVCYMISSLQQLFMMPDFRSRVLAIQTTPKPPAEAADDFITQLQLLFANLQESSLAAVDITPFCRAFKDYEGSPTDILLQQDASEFLTNFFQQIESATMGTSSEHLLRDTVGGVLQNELIANEKTSQRPEPFYVLSVSVGEGRSTLQDGLSSFIAGETVDYTWESTVPGEDGETVTKKECLPTIKRVSIKTLPNFLIIHLKRFGFDFELMQQTKLNDRFEFPLILDMRPYTVEGRDDENVNVADENYLYELSGVVVHYGTANSGHYYSFIKERATQPGKRGGNWLEFNDNFVSEFDVDDLEEETFGGESASAAGATSKLQRGRNAFMLVYDKKIPHVHTDTAAVSVPPDQSDERNAKATPPAHIVKHITSENYEHWRNKCVYTSSYYTFLQDVLLREVAGRTSPSVEHLELVLRVCFGTLVYARERDIVQHWCTWLSYQCKSAYRVGRYVLHFLLRPPVDEKAYWNVYRRVRYLLLYVDDLSIRVSVMNVITESMTSVLTERDDEGIELCERFVALIVLMLRDAQLLWKSLEVYFEPISVLALSSQAKCNLLLQQGVAGKLMSLFLGSDSMYPDLIAGALPDANKSARNMTDATSAADLRSLVRSLCILLANAAIDQHSKAAATGSQVLRKEEAEMLLHRAFIYRLMKLLVVPDNKSIVFPLLRIIAGVSTESFKNVVDILVLFLHKEDGADVKTPLRAVMAILSMNNESYNDAVMSAVVAELTNTSRYLLCTDHGLNMLLRIARHYGSAWNWMVENKQQVRWMEGWLSVRATGAAPSGCSTWKNRRNLSQQHTALGNAVAAANAAQIKLIMDGVTWQEAKLDKGYDSDDDPLEVVGRRIKVMWTEGEFPGTITRYNPISCSHTVVYDDGDVKQHNLSAKQWKFID